MARAKRQPTAGDMVRSLAVILVPVLVITVLFTRNLDDHPVTVVDYGPALAQAREQAPYDVLAPTNLPDSWRPTQVDWVPKGAPYLNGEPSVRNLWRLGYLSPDEIYIEVTQGDLEPDKMVAEVGREGVPDGMSQVGGEPWERRLSPDERTRSLVLRGPDVTSVVVGDTSYEALEAFAGTLSSG